MKSETDVKREIAKYLDSLGSQCWHVPFHNMGYTRNGIPDRLCCYRGRFFAIEAKRPPVEPALPAGAANCRRCVAERPCPRHTPKPAKAPEAAPWQKRELAAIIEAGGRAIVAWTVDHVREEIEAIDAALDMGDYDEKERGAREFD